MFKHKKLVNAGNWAERSLRLVLHGFLEIGTNCEGEEKKSHKMAFSYNMSPENTLSSRLISNSWMEKFNKQGRDETTLSGAKLIS